MSIIRCPHCGTANRAGSNFCNSCGTELRAAPPSHAQELPPVEAEDAPPSAPATAEPPAPPHASPAEPEPPAPVDNQPWLRMEFGGESEVPPFEEEDESLHAEVARLASGMQGLLAPVRIAVRNTDADANSERTHAQPPHIALEQMRLVRRHMESPPVLGGAERLWQMPDNGAFHTPWLYLALGLAILLPALLMPPWPHGAPTQWPGVEEAFLRVQGLPAQAHVTVYWAYDPATAGELDLAALPVVEHLLQRRARLSVVSLLPTGPATARRLIERARLKWQRSESLTAAAESTWRIPVQYLPGGAPMLALAAQNPAQVFAGAPPETPDLAVVFGAQAEDVQHWLEQAAPLNRTPVIAVVGAGADPILRPYWNSGQLVGLVSGFDGAYSYQALLSERLPRLERSPALDSQLVLQDWGLIVFFGAIMLGNLAVVFRRRQEP